MADHAASPPPPPPPPHFVLVFIVLSPLFDAHLPFYQKVHSRNYSENAFLAGTLTRTSSATADGTELR